MAWAAEGTGAPSDSLDESLSVLLFSSTFVFRLSRSLSLSPWSSTSCQSRPNPPSKARHHPRCHQLSKRKEKAGAVYILILSQSNITYRKSQTPNPMHRTDPIYIDAGGSRYQLGETPASSACKQTQQRETERRRPNMNVPPMQIYVQAMYLYLNRSGTLRKFPVCQQRDATSRNERKGGEEAKDPPSEID
ncbi:hypothetical protein BO94DRAFT_201906 [Aspergillus sclerotioniger CBS 115572]|uniref:Uncharacterized protein n=1 Tax=Aspergillus sclerotioniger CBS 115572 TaxID=1450535 RepID=A0A317VTS1_9EURO|nr:hypothetical protein BO94DRAFT_201906 [Aspergillus sclerotioniger CBS 115572]PWY76417.1 hypothetical protein BO94DRAFT_201906 [Aspergillus sclerotioniger CBS 115572]